MDVNDFYEKIVDRASTAGKQTVGGQRIFAKRTGGQKALYAKRDQVPNEEFFDKFCMESNGNAKEKGTKYDSPIREFVIQLATAAANQELRLDAARKGVDKKTIEDVSSGKSRILFAKSGKETTKKDAFGSFEQVENVELNVESHRGSNVLDPFELDLVKNDALLKGKKLRPMLRIKKVEDVKPWIDELKNIGFFKAFPIPLSVIPLGFICPLIIPS